MSIYINGMEMPKNCWDCPIRNSKPCPCKGYSTALEYVTGRHADCPLIPVPEHGRLIDADVLMKTDRMVGKLMMYGGEYVYTQTEIDRAPTIIPADKEGE